MESQNAAGPHAAGVVRGEEEGIRKKRDVQRVGGETSGVDFTHHDIENLLVKELVQQKDHGAAVAGFAGEISLHLGIKAIHIDRGEARNCDGKAMNNGSRT